MQVRILPLAVYKKGKDLIMWRNSIEFETLLGKTLSKIEGAVGDEKMIFTTNEKEVFKLYYDHD